MKRLTTEEFIRRAREVHGDKYNYDKAIYINGDTPIIVTCPEHGDFYPTPSNHIGNKSGCPKCNGGVKIDREEFIRRARETHGDRYNYDKVIYINSSTPVIIGCPEHGDFTQLPSVHIAGSGCPLCNCSKLETTVRLFLNSLNISYKEQMTWDWLVYKYPQHVDFYLQEFNTAIECQGLQHFTNSSLFDKTEPLEVRVERDINKQKLCLQNGIRILYYSNLSTRNKKI